MGFRRIRSQPKSLRIGRIDKFQTSYKIPGFRVENYHTTRRISVPYPTPKIGDPEFSASPWDELRMSFHSYGTVDGSFKMLWQKLVGDPVTQGKNAWDNDLTVKNFEYARFPGEPLITTNELSSGMSTLHKAQSVNDPPEYPTLYLETNLSSGPNTGGTTAWGEMRVKNPDTSIGGDGRFWFWTAFSDRNNTEYPCFAITKVQAFKHGSLVKEFPVNPSEGAHWTLSPGLGMVTMDDRSQDDEFGGSIGIGNSTIIIASSGRDPKRIYINDLDSNYVNDIIMGSGYSYNVTSIAIGDNDNTIVVGRPFYNSPSTQYGTAYIYNRDGTLRTTLSPVDTGGGYGSFFQFGYSVAIGNNKVVVSSSGEGVFVYDLDGSNGFKLLPSDHTSAYDGFGHALAVGNNKIVVGSEYDDDDGSSSGSVYVYDLDGTNEVKITASDGAGLDYFGRSVAVGNNKIVVGSPQSELNNRGSVYVYDLNGTNEVKITASDQGYYDYFGRSVAVGNNKIVVGAYGDDDDSGSAYVYDLDGSNEVKITASDAASDDTFGDEVGIGTAHIFVSAPDEFNSRGAVYRYDLDGTNELKITAKNDPATVLPMQPINYQGLEYGGNNVTGLLQRDTRTPVSTSYNNSYTVDWKIANNVRTGWMNINLSSWTFGPRGSQAAEGANPYIPLEANNGIINGTTHFIYAQAANMGQMTGSNSLPYPVPIQAAALSISDYSTYTSPVSGDDNSTYTPPV